MGLGFGQLARVEVELAYRVERVGKIRLKTDVRQAPRAGLFEQGQSPAKLVARFAHPLLLAEQVAVVPADHRQLVGGLGSVGTNRLERFEPSDRFEVARFGG